MSQALRRTLLRLSFLLSLNLLGQESSNVTLLSNLSYHDTLSDVWGYATIDSEYALVGVYDGISIVDVTDPEKPNQLVFYPGYKSKWRDLKTWTHYLYVVNETGGGLQIVDLSRVVQGDIDSSYTENVSLGFETAHNIYIDEKGVLYVFGYDNEGGVLMYDVSNNPENPTLLGSFNDYYIHDGMARGDTLWAAAINDGLFSVIDVVDKANPRIMASHETPSLFSHNCWISDDGDYLYTTDEVGGAYVTAYDVSDLTNIDEVDRMQSWSIQSDVVPHNTHVLGDFLVTSYYADGLSIVDVSEPSNMVEVAYYDTSPFYTGNGFHGAWGAYPWLPSGNILVTDMEEGLYVLSFNRSLASRIRGQVSDVKSGLPIRGAELYLINKKGTVVSDLKGFYQTGLGEEGVYDLVCKAPGYQDFVQSVTLIKGDVLDFEIQMTPQSAPHIYPNPSYSGSVNIHATEDLHVFVTSLEGKFQTSLALSEGHQYLDLSFLKPGVYIMQLSSKAKSDFKLWIRH